MVMLIYGVSTSAEGAGRSPPTDPFAPLILPACFGGGAFGIFLLRRFFMGIPRDLGEAAFIDGAARAMIYARIILPLARPAPIVVALFCFMGCRGDCFGPPIYLRTNRKFALAVGLPYFLGKYTTKWNVVMAASTLVAAHA